ncbi:hypothetical protein BX666DRAFT_2027478 [Dichotomocladium elegans]|nr:hypothetical protein BX666DRAFT_2027478 [Dichotomocladium elegans]
MSESSKDSSHEEAATTGPSTIWTRIAARYRFGKQLLVGAGICGVIAVMFIVIGTLDVFSNQKYQAAIGSVSIGETLYPGNSWGTVSEGFFNLSGEGDGTYYDPGVGVTACGTRFTAQDMIVALNYIDYGTYANSYESPVCGACIRITGPLGSAKAIIQDECPVCGRGSVDMSPAVFGQVGSFFDGRIPISWTPC